MSGRNTSSETAAGWNCLARSSAAARRHRGTGIFERQVKREAGASARSAAQMNFAAEQACKLAADREPKAGAAVFAAGAGVCLLESFEDQFLLFQGDTDAAVRHLEGDHGGRSVEDGMFGTPAAECRGDFQADSAFGGELERIRQQILQHLLQ